MSFLTRNGVLLLASGIALIAVAFLAAPNKRRSKPSSSSTAALVSAAPAPAPAPSGPVRIVKNFVFDCSSFAPAATPSCPAPPANEQAFLDAANSYRAGALATWSKEFADRAEAALRVA